MKRNATPDTSAILAALSDWHPQHDVARPALRGRSVIVGHCLLEAYSVLTRLPHPHRVEPGDAAAVLGARFTRTLSLPDDEAVRLPHRLHELGVMGGASYDGLIAITALHHRMTLQSLDARAAETYRRCGADVQWLGDG